MSSPSARTRCGCSMRRRRPQPAAPPTSSCPAHVFLPRPCLPAPPTSSGRNPTAGHAHVCRPHCPLLATPSFAGCTAPCGPRPRGPCPPLLAKPSDPAHRKATPRTATPSCRFLQVTLPCNPPAQRAHGETKARRSGGAGLRAGARRRTDPALAVLTRTHTPPRRPALPPHDRVPAPDTHPHVLLRVPPSREPKMTPTPKHRPNRPRAAGRSSGADRSVMAIWAATGWDGGADKRGPLADRLVAYGPRPRLAIPAPQTQATGHALTPLHSSDLPPPPATPPHHPRDPDVSPGRVLPTLVAAQATPHYSSPRTYPLPRATPPHHSSIPVLCSRLDRHPGRGLRPNPWLRPRPHQAPPPPSGPTLGPGYSDPFPPHS